ncbi:MAG: hypothetical protein BroJett011_14300 [Chloroflexota bacterium]|nr:MAG: hypothetical protein BroJett011_14300 [Chloroflexota bacterium]
MVTDTARRDLLKLAVLLPLMPTLTIQSDEPHQLTPPAHPVDRNFETPAELATYLAEVEQYLSASTAQIRPDPDSLAEELERRIVELTAFCLAIGTKPNLAQRVATILLDEMGSAEMTLSNYYAFAASDDPNWRREALETKLQLWNGAGVFPLSKPVDDFINRRGTLLVLVEYLFGLTENPEV